MRALNFSIVVASLVCLISSNANADTTSVKLHKIVEVKKKGEHCEQDPNCFNRYHPAIKLLRGQPLGTISWCIHAMRSTQT